MNKKNNHYVPQFYIRNIAEHDKLTGLYNIRSGKYIREASIKKQAFKPYLYGDDGKLEDYLMDIETPTSRVIKNIIESYHLPHNEEDILLLITFIVLTEARTLKTAEYQNAFTDKLSKHIMKLDNNVGIHEEDFDKFNVSYEIPNAMAINSSIETIPLLFDLDAVLIRNTSDRFFLSSDNPLIFYNQFYSFRNYHRNYGYLNQGLQLFLPLSPRLMLCLYDSETYKPFEYDLISINKGKEIDKYNSLIYLNAHRNLFFKNTISENYIHKLHRAYHTKRSSSGNSIQTLGPEDNKLFFFGTSRIKEYFNLKHFKIKEEKRNEELPLHLGGPTRERAQLVFDQMQKEKGIKTHRNDIDNQTIRRIVKEVTGEEI